VAVGLSVKKSTLDCIGAAEETKVVGTLSSVL
jgi:hypothetical protein